ncbi:uncharacterized protein LOC121373547 [Gigantopelta aegis]|uniref:uncharacterized protein LOC121373547 n=1 Tax=Gigantopelta aegis TaxID=1735272 RepID=UPI001B88B768|nr:uncharacterized protein LOC121373547 [Gigantopelta aegis]
MALAKSTPLRFSSVHGQNVLLGDKMSTSTWEMSAHWGTCVTNRQLLKGEIIELELTGSGHMFIGLLRSKPNENDILGKKSPVRIVGDNWVHFRLKKNNFVVRLEKTSTKEVTFYSGGDNKSEVFKIPDCWLCCDLLFGDIEVKLLRKDKSDKKSSSKRGSPFCFDSVCGPNVSLCSNSTIAKLKHINPSSICCTDRPVVQGDVIEIKVEPIRDAKWTYIKIYMSNFSSRDLKIDQADFERLELDKTRELLPLTTLKNTQATIIVQVREDRKITYTVCGDEKLCDVTGLDLSKSIYVYFELFRVKLTLTSVLRTPDMVDYPKIKEIKEDVDDGYLTPVAVNTKKPTNRTSSGKQEYSEYCILIPNNDEQQPTGRRVNSGSGGAEGASGPEPEVELTVRDISNQIAVLRRTTRHGRTDRQDDCNYYRGMLRDMKTKLISIESSSSNNQVILDKISDLERQLSEFVTLQTQPAPKSKALSTSSELESCIQNNYTRFLDEMEPDIVLDYLFEFGVITSDQMYKLQAMEKADRRKKNREILQLMRTKAHKIDLLKKALVNSGQQDLANLLD